MKEPDLVGDERPEQAPKPNKVSRRAFLAALTTGAAALGAIGCNVTIKLGDDEKVGSLDQEKQKLDISTFRSEIAKLHLDVAGAKASQAGVKRREGEPSIKSRSQLSQEYQSKKEKLDRFKMQISGKNTAELQDAEEELQNIKNEIDEL